MQFLEYTVNTGEGTVDLPYQKYKYILSLLDLLSTKYHIGSKYLERLLRNIQSMHLVVPVEISYLSHIKHAMTQG